MNETIGDAETNHDDCRSSRTHMRPFKHKTKTEGRKTSKNSTSIQEKKTVKQKQMLTQKRVEKQQAAMVRNGFHSAILNRRSFTCKKKKKEKKKGLADVKKKVCHYPPFSLLDHDY